MMIEKHISALLYRYQCVIVPGFGAFLTETSSARFNELTGTFSPPKKMLSFNSQLKNNDGLLGNHIALEENLSYDDALVSIKKGVSNWLEILDQNKTLYLKNIGEIQLNQERKLIFEPIGSTNYLTSSFGLSSILVANIERKKSEQKQAVVIPIQKAKQGTNYLKYAAILVVGLGLFGSIMNYQNNLEINSQKTEIEKQVQQEVQNKIQQATFFIETPKAVTEVSKIVDENIVNKEKELRYHIVAGSFRTEAKAQILVDQLQEKGYKNSKYLVKSKHGMRPVVYNSYKTKDEAQAELKLIHQKVNKDAWVYVEE